MNSEMKIRSKLLVGFGILLVSVIIVAATAFYAISSLSSKVHGLVETSIPQLKNAATLNDNIRSSALAIDDAYFDEGADSLKNLEAATSGNRKGTLEAIKGLKASLASEQEQPMMLKLMEKRNAVAAQRDKIVALLKEGKKAEMAAEIKVAKSLRNEFLAALKEIDNHLQEQAKLEALSTESSAHNARTVITALVVAVLVVTLLVAFWIMRAISGPLHAVVATANRIAQRDLTVEVEGNNGTETGQLMAAMMEMVGNLKSIVSQTSGISAHIASASTELYATSRQMANGAQEVASQTHTVATASEEMSATSNDIAHSCHLAARSSQQAISAAEIGAKVVAQTVEVMSRIAQGVNASAATVGALGSRSEQIGNIIGTIEDIADQTNLLALNAAIEAARAGEQGRGFAVVADEVRALAERTTKATKEIGAMIKAIQTETQQAVLGMQEGVREVSFGTEEAAKSGQALQEILDQINAVSLQVNQIATAAEEQTATIGQITGNINDISEVVRRTAQGSKDSEESASRLATLSDDLITLVGQFKLR